MTTASLHGATKPRIAVVLAGCGARDGSEITESVALLIALSRQGWSVQCFAPNRSTTDVINHLSGHEKPGEKRNQLEEAARIARGAIKPITELKADDFAAVALSGGFGVAKNLCNFAAAGREASLAVDVRDALLPFIKSKKPAAALCIAPIVLALLGREAGLAKVQLTLGSGAAQDAVSAIEAWGSSHVPTHPGQACIDAVNRFVSAPAYMFDDATPADIFASAEALVNGIASLLEARPREH